MRLCLLAFIPASLVACSIDEGAPDELASSTQDIHVDGLCAVEHAANADGAVGPTGDTYSRAASTINTTCECLAWEREAVHDPVAADHDHPNCRPATNVDFTVTGTMKLSAATDFSSITTQAECTLSKFEVDFWKGNGMGQWVKQGSTIVVAPTWYAGSCQSHDMYESFNAQNGKFRVRATASRGVTNGYQTVSISATPIGGPS